jgi:YesN/AraC family two-component response regulator
MASRSLLWVDLRAKRSAPDLCSSLPKPYGAQRITCASEIPPRIESVLPWAVCFEYDCPDARGLQVLAETKRHHSSTPIVMLTAEHSQSLAEWALRTCVWDYLIKPVSLRNLCHCLMTIYRGTPAGTPSNPGAARQLTGDVQPGLDRELSGKWLLVLSYVEANYVEKISLATVAGLCGLSPFQFSRAFKKAKGVTFRDFVLDFRIERAAQSLKNPGAPVTDVAFGVGFNDLSYFARMFRWRFGVSPSHYRETHETRQLLLFPPEDAA